MITQDNQVCAVTLANQILHHAIANAASDVHFEPMVDQLRVRLRIDGMLYDQKPIDLNISSQLITRLKVLANINIAQKRIPQDGKFSLICKDQEIDLRLSTFPTYYGEKVVVRILQKAEHVKTIDQLGFATPIEQNLKMFLQKSSGFFLVSGPTGSGKTTTLYAALNQLNSAQKNIVTLEDPIEYSIAGIIQGQIQPESGFTFEHGIRAVLRQDPDILMIGEIRDKQTARTAIEAALTGHLVLSTIHTTDSVNVITRLMDMGIEPFLINVSVSAILAQRLARKLCIHCKFERTLNEQESIFFSRFTIPIKQAFDSKGCQECAGFGFKGRMGIFEFLPINDKIRQLIIQKTSYENLFKMALKQGMQPLIIDGLHKVQQGLTTLSEIIRVVL